MQPNILLLLKLLDVVAAASDVDGDEAFAKLRTKIGEFVVENRVPSKPEFDALTGEADALIGKYSDEDHQRFEDPATHVAPAGLKSDVLRTSTKGPSAAATPLRDPYAVENQREGTDDPQALARLASAEAEKGVAYKDGENALTPSQITAQSVTNGASAATPTAHADIEPGATDNASEDGENGPEGEEQEPDFEGTTVPDLKAYLDEQGVEYSPKALKPELVELAKEAYAKAQANQGEGDENEDDNGGE